MITKTDLCKVIASAHVEEGDSSFKFDEPKNKQYGLKVVRFDNSGHYIAFRDTLLKASRSMYEAQYQEVHFHKDCDKVVLFEKNGQRYLFWIEVKTSLKQIFNTGIYQIPGCYYRIKALLDEFPSHDPNNIIECALAIYAPDAPPPPQTNSVPAKVVEYTTTKRAKIAPPETEHERIERKYKSILLPRTKGVMEGVDFGMEQLPINENYKLNTLPFIIWPVTYKGAVVNMDDVISLL